VAGDLGEAADTGWKQWRYSEQDIGSGVVIGACVQDGQLPQTPSGRTPNYQTGRASDRPVEAFKRWCPGEAQWFSKSRKGGCPRARKTRNSAEDIGSDASRHYRQPRHPRREEIIGERRNVADAKHWGEAGWNVRLR